MHGLLSVQLDCGPTTRPGSRLRLEHRTTSSSRPLLSSASSTSWRRSLGIYNDRDIVSLPMDGRPSHRPALLGLWTALCQLRGENYLHSIHDLLNCYPAGVGIGNRFIAKLTPQQKSDGMDTTFSCSREHSDTLLDIVTVVTRSLRGRLMAEFQFVWCAR